jgi:hypothetical protein
MRSSIRRKLKRLEALLSLLRVSGGSLIGIAGEARAQLAVIGQKIRSSDVTTRLWYERLRALLQSEGGVPAPIVTAFLPDVLNDGIVLGDTIGGQLLLFQGAFLATTTSVTVGGTPATIVRVTPSAVYALAPAKAPGTYTVILTTLGGDVTFTNAYQAWDPTLLAGAWVYDSRSGVTQAGNRVSAWADRAGSGVTPAQATAGFRPNFDAKDWASFFNIAPGMWGAGTSGPGAVVSFLDTAKQALATGKTYFWISKVPTTEVRTTAGTQGNVADSMVGDDAAGGWSGNAGYGGQQGDPAGSGGEISMINWNDSVGGFQRMTWNGTMHDGLPHCVMITHSHIAPYPAEAYLDNVRIANGRIAPQLAGGPIVAQATPFHSDYNAANLGWNALLGGKIAPGAEDDGNNADTGAIVIVNRVVTAPEGTLLFKWAHNTFSFQFYTWERTSTTAPFTPQDGVGLVFFKGKLYRICGWDGLANKIVASSSNEGATWVQLPDFPGIAGHAMPVILHTDSTGKEWIMVIGGDPAGGQTGEIWRTDNPEDASAWELVNATSPTLGHSYYFAASIGGAIYIAGGQTDANDATTASSRVYKSVNDGFAFVQLADAPWAPRSVAAFGELASGDGIVVCGGAIDAVDANCTYFNDAWTINPTTDAWTLRLADGHTLFPPRRYTRSFELQGFFWFGSGFGGYGAPGVPADNILDLQFTADGTTYYPYHYPRWLQTHADSWAVDVTNQIAYHGFGISGGSDFWKFRPNPT